MTASPKTVHLNSELSARRHSLTYRPDIDGLRAVAVVFVMIFHAFPQVLPGGFVGVDIFFVISGFLISAIIFKDVQRGEFHYADFYDRRIRRIVPALLLVIVATISVGWAILLPTELVSLAKVAIGSAVFIPNIVLWAQTSYFAPDAQTVPLLHLWSLGVEEQFYLIWPAVILAFWRKSMWPALAAIAVASFAICVLIVRHHQPEAFFLPITRFWELMCGAILSRAQFDLGSDPAKAQRSAGYLCEFGYLVGIALLFFGAYRIRSQANFPGFKTLVPILGAVLAIGLAPNARFGSRIMSNRLLVFIGVISYPLYLWHWPMLSYLRIFIGDDPAPLWKAFALASAAVLAYLSYRFVEMPIRKLRPGNLRIKAALGLVSGLAGVAALSGLVVAASGFPTRFPAQLRELASYKFGVPGSYREGACFLHPYQNAGAWREDLCLPQTANQELVVLWGDSHAAHLRAGLEQIANGRFQIAQMTASSCPPYLGKDFPLFPNCRAANDRFWSLIKKLKPATIILAADWYDNDIEGFDATLKEVTKLGIGKVVVVGPVPRWVGPLPGLLVRQAMWNRTGLSRTLANSYRAPADENSLDALAAKYGASYYSPLKRLCDDHGCLTMLNDSPQSIVTWDLAHLTDTGSKYVLAPLANHVLKN